MIRAQRLPVRRTRFTELSLLFWVAALAITGFVAVVAAETSSFGPAAIAVPVVFLVLMLALHLFLVARRFHMSVSSITLFLLGGIANLTREPPSARAEFFMAAAGPATSVAIGVIGLAVAQLAETSLREAPWLQTVGAVAGYLGPINLLLAVFNLIPGFPLDGGRVLR